MWPKDEFSKILDSERQAKEPAEGSNSLLIDGLAADRLKKAVSEVLSNALSGQAPGLRNDKGFIRWGLVEKIIHQEVDAAFRDGGG